MGLVVVAGSVTVVGFADRAGSSAWLVVPLLVLGLVAIPAIGGPLVNPRR